MLFYVYYIKNSEKNELLRILKKLFLDCTILKKKKKREASFIFLIILQ